MHPLYKTVSMHRSVPVKRHYFSAFRIRVLTIKAPIMTAADDIRKYFFIAFHRK